MNINKLIQKKNFLNAEELIRASYDIFNPDVIATSSFGATAGTLIHILASLKLPIKIVYVNTGFLFKETLDYIEQLRNIYTGLEFVEVAPKLKKNRFLKRYGSDIYSFDPDFCCRVNKVEPINNYLYANKIKAWITGLRSHQTENRQGLSPVAQSLNGIYKIAPLLNWTAKDVHYYMKDKDIPFHPLYEKGYTSIGCEPCTELPIEDDDERSGRWRGKTKKECGLHLNI